MFKKITVSLIIVMALILTVRPIHAMLRVTATVNVSGALIFNTVNATAAKGQVHQGTIVTVLNGGNIQRTQVEIQRSVAANGWGGTRAFINTATIACNC